MLAAYLNSLDEMMSRRMAYVLCGIALIITFVFNYVLHIQNTPRGALLVMGKGMFLPAIMVVPAVLQEEIGVTSFVWFLLVIFATAPLLTASLEKGWLDLTFSKGTARWKIYLGRFLGGVSLYAFTFALATFPLAARIWWSTGMPTWSIAVALLIQSLSFASVFSISALAALLQKGPALPIIGSVGVLVVSSPLADRQVIYQALFSSQIFRELTDWTYRVLPKVVELETLCRYLVAGDKFNSGYWWPIWSTAAFTVAILSLTMWLLHRKSF
jgi:ABC-type transport system involved in multi-copper enzyme maturation permease subunit